MIKDAITLNEYQTRAMVTAVYPGQGTFIGLQYTAGKLAGEAGEVIENVCKAVRDDNAIRVGIVNSDFTGGCSFDVLTESRRLKLKKELGDVLWYVATTAKELGFTLEEIAVANLLKLADRKERGVLHGSGDER